MKPYASARYLSTLYLLPTSLMVEEKLKQISDNGDVLIGCRFMTFPELINALAKDFPSAQRQISSLGELLLVKDAVLSVYAKPSAAPFPFAKDSFVFFRAMNKFIRELRQSFVLSRDLEKALMDIDNEKYRMFAKIYSYYENKIDSLNLTDDIGIQKGIIISLEKFKGLPQSISGMKRLVIEGFYDLLPLQRRLVNALIEKGLTPEIIPVYNLENPDATKAGEDLLNFFEAMDNLSPESIIFKPVVNKSSKEGITAIVNNLFKISKTNECVADANRSVCSGGSVSLIAGPGRYMEIEAVGREIRKLLQNGIKPNEIGVMFRDITIYEEIVGDVFKRFKIPLYFKRGRNLLGMPVIKNILSIYDTIEAGFERESVLKLLNSGYVTLSEIASGGHIEFKDIERVVSEIKVVGEDTEGWDNAFERYLRGLDIKGEAGVDMTTLLAVKGLILNLISMLKEIDKPQPFKRHKDSLYAVVKRLGIEKMCRLNSWHQDMQALEILTDAISGIENTLLWTGKGKSSLSAREFFCLVTEALADKFLPAYKNKGGIKVLSISDAAGLRFKYLFICGLNDGEFPCAETPHLFIRDDDKKFFNSAVRAKLFLTHKAQWWREPLMFMLAVGMAEERLWLTYSYIDETGRELPPSIFVRDVCRILKIDTASDNAFFRKMQVSEVIAEIEDALEREELAVSILKAVYLPYSDPGRRYAEEVLKLAGCEGEFKNNISRLIKVCSIERLRSNNKEDAAFSWRGGIADADLKRHIKEELLGSRGVWSATMFETIAGCPFSFYMKYILKLVEPEETDVEINRLASGSIIHRILERFYKTAKEKRMLPLAGSEMELLLLNSTISLVFQETFDADFTGSKGLWEIKKRCIADMLRQYYKDEVENHDRSFIPEHFEIDLTTPIVLADATPLSVKGRIDRIDISHHALRIIDYKMGSIPPKDEIGRLYFQLPIYILAAARHFNTESSRCSGIYYSFKNNKREEVKTVKTDSGIQKISDYLNLQQTEGAGLTKDIDRLINFIRTGDFQTKPYNERLCLHCKFKNICRYQNA